MNELRIFECKEFGKIKIIVENGKEYFPASECARILGYSNPYDAVARHCNADGLVKREVGVQTGTKIDGSPSVQTMNKNYITEGNLYRLIANSQLPSAVKFEHWVFDEVLPTIRKTGGYVNNEETFISTYLPFADEQTKLLFSTTLKTVQSLNRKIEQDKPKVIFADAVAGSKTSILVGDLAKLLKQNGIEIGQKRLFAWLRENSYLIKTGESYNRPTQRAMERKLFEVKVRTVGEPDHSLTTYTTMVTGKGQEYFINRFLKDKQTV